MVQSIFIHLGEGAKVTAMLRRWSSRGLGTPEVKIPSVPVPVFTGNIVEQLSRTTGGWSAEPAEITGGRGA